MTAVHLALDWLLYLLAWASCVTVPVGVLILPDLLE